MIIRRSDWEQALAAGDGKQRFLLDVRAPLEFAAGHVPGEVNIPLDGLRARLLELPTDRPIFAYCQVGARGYFATRILLQHGFEAANIGGGYANYLLSLPATGVTAGRRNGQPRQPARAVAVPLDDDDHSGR